MENQLCGVKGRGFGTALVPKNGQWKRLLRG